MSDLASAVTAPKVGDVWKEVDPRMERYVCVLELSASGYARLARCDANGEGQSTRLTRAQLDRFNGKRGGYALHRRAR